MAKVISPVDNTGYRMRPGNELHVFTKESDCIAAWNEQIERACFELETKELMAAKGWRLQKEALAKCIVK